MAKPKDMTEELGESGVTIFDGQIVGEEYNPDLKGSLALDAYDKMRRNDATVKASLRVVKLPIESAEYRVDSAPVDEGQTELERQYEAARRVVEVSFFEFNDWKKFISEALTHLDFGFVVFEMVFGPRYIDGTLRLALTKFGFRKQLSIYAWQTIDQQPGITQWLMTGKTISIPIEKLIHIANEQEGDNYEGQSILRPAYKHWMYKDKMYKIDAVAAENHALGIAKITKPRGAKDKDEAAVKAWAKNRRANETSHIILPEGWDAELMNMQGGNLKNIQPSIEHHDNQILKNVLAQFLNLGSNGTGSGSRSVSEDHSRLFVLGVKRVADNIIYAVQRTAVRTLVDLNFNVSEYPQLHIGDISDENIPMVTEAIKVAVDAGVLHPSSADEAVVRKMLSLPQRALEELDELFEKSDEKEPIEKKASEVAEVTDELRALRTRIEGAIYGSSEAA